MDDLRLEALVRQVRDLPALPAAVVRVMQLTEDPKAGMADVARALASDQALAARVLKLANSAFYGASRRISRRAARAPSRAACPCRGGASACALRRRAAPPRWRRCRPPRGRARARPATSEGGSAAWWPAARRRAGPTRAQWPARLELGRRQRQRLLARCAHRPVVEQHEQAVCGRQRPSRSQAGAGAHRPSLGPTRLFQKRSAERRRGPLARDAVDGGVVDGHGRRRAGHGAKRQRAGSAAQAGRGSARRRRRGGRVRREARQARSACMRWMEVGVGGRREQGEAELRGRRGASGAEPRRLDAMRHSDGASPCLHVCDVDRHGALWLAGPDTSDRLATWLCPSSIDGVSLGRSVGHARSAPSIAWPSQPGRHSRQSSLAVQPGSPESSLAVQLRGPP